MPGLFSVHFCKHHPTDEMRPVDQVLKGMEDCVRATQGAVQGQGLDPRKEADG